MPRELTENEVVNIKHRLAHHDKVELSYEEAEALIDCYYGMNGEHTTEVNDLNDELAHCKAEVAHCKAEVDDLNEQIESLEKEKESLKKEVDTLRDQVSTDG